MIRWMGVIGALMGIAAIGVLLGGIAAAIEVPRGVAGLTPTQEPSAEPLRVGFGEGDVTPKLDSGRAVYLAGFGHNRKATGVHDPIMARAVVLEYGRERLALVSVDVVGIFLPTVERIRQRLPQFRYVLVSATHNHEGPDTLGLWGPTPLQTGVDPDFMKQLEDGCVAAVERAIQKLRPAHAAMAISHEPDLLHDSRLPIVLHDELVVLRFEDPQSKAPLGLLVQWNNHPEVLDSKNTLITADFPYYVVKMLQERHRCPVAYFTGTVGGLMTPLGLKVLDAAGRELRDGTFEKAERYGELLAAAIDKALRNAQPIRLHPFAVHQVHVLIPINNKLYRLGWQLGTLQRPVYVWNGEPRPKEFVETKDVSRPVAVKTEIGYLRLGELEVAVIPGEIYPELVLGKVQDPADPGADFPNAPIEPAIYAQLRGRHRMIIGLGNDELGYFIPKRQWDEKPPFCYGLKKAQYGEINSVGPEAAPIICEAFRRLVPPP